jgi:hypothetical protein
MHGTMNLKFDSRHPGGGHVFSYFILSRHALCRCINKKMYGYCCTLILGLNAVKGRKTDLSSDSRKYSY